MDLGEVLWAMVAFYFWFLIIWMFIRVFGDVFRRDDLSGWAKAGWILLIVVLPFIGLLVYVIVRPRMTEQDRRIAAEMHEGERRAAGYSAADEVAKLARLRDSGELTASEYEALKARAMSDA